MEPDERAFRADVAKAPFRIGQAEQRWHLVSIDWPIVLMGVTARDSREYVLRFDCGGYPEHAPTARLWDVGTGAPLPPNEWPQSHGGDLMRIELASAAPLGSKRGWKSAYPIVQWRVTR